MKVFNITLATIGFVLRVIEEILIPNIKRPDIMESFLQSIDTESDNPLNVAKKVVNEYDERLRMGQGNADDLSDTSLLFGRPWMDAQPKIIWTNHIVPYQQVLRAFRNAFAHDNYRYDSLKDG